MAIPRFDPFTPVEMTWIDAFSDITKYGSVSEALQAYKPCIRKTVAKYIGVAERNGQRAVLLVTDDDRTPDDPEAMGAPIWTPVAMVIDLQPLILTKRKK